MLARLDSESIDKALEAITDRLYQIEAACSVARLGYTEIRADLVADGFADFLNNPSLLWQW